VPITDQRASNSPQNISVTFTVSAGIPAPTIVRSPTTVALSVQQGIDERMINARAVSDVDRRFRENAMIVAMARSEQARLQREQEDAGRLTSFETQQRARTSTMDGRGVTGFFNQSKSIEDSGRKTADNTKATADAVKAVSSTLDKLFTGGAFISL
jgi:hypothetical protein